VAMQYYVCALCSCGMTTCVFVVLYSVYMYVYVYVLCCIVHRVYMYVLYVRCMCMYCMVLYVMCGCMCCDIHYVYVYVIEENQGNGCLMVVETDSVCVQKNKGRIKD